MRSQQFEPGQTGIRGYLLAAGPTVGLRYANSALGVSRAHGYALAKRGQYPVKVLKLGSSYRVITADLLNVLGIKATEECGVERTLS